MTIEVLYFDGCPNHDALVPHLRRLLANSGVWAEMALRRVESDADAQRLRFLGSPSVRVDGRDVEPGAEARDDFGLKCRLYQTPDGLRGVPPDAWVLTALGVDTPVDGGGRSLAAELLAQRSARDRLDGVPSAYRRLHHRVLRAFVDGEPPDADDLARWATELEVDLDEAIAELERHDVLWRDRDTGGVSVAYPFSGRPTAHVVWLQHTAAEVFAMCAIDALGIPFLAHQPAEITAHDPASGNRIDVAVDPAGQPRWTPATAAVAISVSGEGPSATCFCPHVNLVADPRHTDGATLEMAEAIAVGRRIFGRLLDEPAGP
jgi:hypothetical protein